MRTVRLWKLALPFALAVPLGAAPQPANANRWEAESAALNPARVDVLALENFSGGRGVALKAGATGNTGSPQTPPDLVFTVRAPNAGRYWFRTHAAVDDATAGMMRQASHKSASLRLTISIDGSRPSSRVVFVPWSPPGSCTQALGKYECTGQGQEVRVWLPPGVRLDSLHLTPYVPPKVPTAAETYQPRVVPPPARPRLWVNADSLPLIRARLTQGENAPVWTLLQKQASKPYAFTAPPDTAVAYSASLEQAAAAKALVSLMNGDHTLAREAVALMSRYLAAVEFDNLLDITREVGRALYTGSLVYDWCYGEMSTHERDLIRRNLLRLAEDMEIGWPPFLQSIVNGHGNEAQVNRDLLAMSIAIYDEDPLPYRYCSYRILEELVPMRRFEYQSPRHNQGVSYGPYRYSWDLHAAWLFRRMTGRPVFDENLARVYQHWLYLRLPDGQMLRDGDGYSDGRPANLGATPLLAYAYSGDPVIKGDLERQGWLPSDPILFLLLNDPGIKAEPSLASLPLTKDFGPVLGSMVARTGWTLGPAPSDVVVEMKGGGFHFGNHQHSDAGSFQIYYRGPQAVDLGQYAFYGTPYDSNFNKRSLAHNLLLVTDPSEDFRLPSNDGGTRNVRTCPATPEQVTQDPLFANGQVLSASYGPAPHRPFFSYFSVDLRSAYSAKIQNCVRTFCFLNLDRAPTPAALIVLDHLTTSRPEFRKQWQINSLHPPHISGPAVVLENSAFDRKGQVRLRMLRPAPEDRTVEILSGEAAHTVSGQRFTPPRPEKPEAQGHRILFSPKKSQATDVFLTVLTMAEETAPELPVELAETPHTCALSLAGRLVVLSRDGTLLTQAFPVQIPPGGDCQLLLTGLAPGVWSLRSDPAGMQWNARVEPGRNTAFFVLPGGSTCSIQPQAIPGAAEYAPAPDFVPRQTETRP